MTDAQKRDLIENLEQNRAGDSVRVSAEYIDYIAAELARFGQPGVGCPRRASHPRFRLTV